MTGSPLLPRVRRRAAEHPAQDAARIPGQQQVVVRERSVGPRAVRTEIQHVQRHAGPRRAQPAARQAAIRGEQPVVRVPGVGVGDDDVGVAPRAVREPHPHRTAGFDQDAIDRRTALDAPAQPLEQRAERVDECCRPADRIVHAPPALELDDERVEGGSVRRVAADEERVEGQGPAQKRVADASVDESLNAEGRPVPEQEGQHPQHDVQLHHRALGVRVEGVEDPAHPAPSRV